MSTIISGLVGAAIAAVIIYTVVKPKMEETAEEIRRKNQEIMEKARLKAQEIEMHAKEKVLKYKEELVQERDRIKEEEKQARERMEKHESRLEKKEDELKEKEKEIESKTGDITKKEVSMKEKSEHLEKVYTEAMEKLEKIAGLGKEEAKKQLLETIEQTAQDELLEKLHKVERETKEAAEEKARNIIVGAIQKYASEVTSESTSTIVELPSDEIKGRIIGREGRNIQSFELATGTDVIVDDTPGSVVISGFDLLRRYVAKVSLEKLIGDGRIHPAKIEETVQKVKEEAAKLVKEFGEKAVVEIGLTGIHPDLIKLVGRLRFRTSYGQNVLRHSLEVGFLAASIAEEVGADVNTCKKGGFLHDIGKAVTHEVEGGHALIGRDILKKFKVSEEVIHTVEAHHNDVEPHTIEALVVQAADAISASRPGARRESLNDYLRRMKDLEETVSGFEGIKKVYAIQAGREVRVFAEPEKVSDLEMHKLAKDIANKVEAELDYPGQIKVNLIRENRVVEYAK